MQTLLRIHFMQQWFNLNDPAMQEALHAVPAFRDFAGLSHWDEHIHSEPSTLRLRHLLERYKQLFALSNLWMVGYKLLAMGQVRAQRA